MDSLFDPTCVPVRVTINKLNFFPNRKMPRFVSVLQNCGGLRMRKPYISVVFFYPVLHRPRCFPDVYFAALTWNLIESYGIRNPGLWNPESSPGNPESNTWNPESNLIRTVSSNFTSNHHLPPPLGFLYHHQHQKVFVHLACTSNMSTLQLGGFHDRCDRYDRFT